MQGMMCCWVGLPYGGKVVVVYKQADGQSILSSNQVSRPGSENMGASNEEEGPSEISLCVLRFLLHSPFW